MIVYFTGTGNSGYCAKFLADWTGDDCIDAFSYIRNGIAAELNSLRPWVFVCPTYGWRIPRVFADFIRSGSFSGNPSAYFVMTCGNDIGNADFYNQTLCGEKGFQYRGTLPVVMPENYIALFQAPQLPEVRAILAAARPVMEQGASCIQTGQAFPKRKTGLIDGLKSGAVNSAFYRFYIKAKPFTVSDRCISCGKCAALCPLGNIQLRGGKPSWGNRCTHCMACICSCPAEAIEYGRRSQGKIRYQCPAYKKGE